MWIQTKLNWFPLSVIEQSGSSVTVAILVEDQTIVRSLIFLETGNHGSLREIVSVLFLRGSDAVRLFRVAKPRLIGQSAHAVIRLMQAKEDMMMFYQSIPDSVFRVPWDPAPCRFVVRLPREANFSPVDGRIDYSIWCNFLGNYGLRLGNTTM
ncbi:uncharacterized protein An16g07320 [Aspergillus niger]|uniref:Contig An16c0230, genomic contig n=2 Tax=Aspergillus niger TaxID=5061 RepID=A2R8J0_ASPNC|nr:uncharacterized protein An16g07320 [Aspergillus niger]CAL00505.1 unnamed protein product [Aspergillus niger]